MEMQFDNLNKKLDRLQFKEQQCVPNLKKKTTTATAIFTPEYKISQKSYSQKKN